VLEKKVSSIMGPLEGGQSDLGWGRRVNRGIAKGIERHGRGRHRFPAWGERIVKFNVRQKQKRGGWGKQRER